MVLKSLFWGWVAAAFLPSAMLAAAPFQEQSDESVPLSLGALVEEATSKNPLIQAARRSVDAKRLRIRPAATLPDPSLQFQTMGDFFPPTLQAGDPSSGRNFTVTQEIPFPGKLRLQGRIAQAEAEEEWWAYEQLRRQVVSELKEAYYEQWFLTRSLDTVNKNKKLLEQFSEISQARYQVGEGLQQDVIRAQVEISKLLDRLLVLEQREAVSQALLNNLLYRPPETPLAKLAEVTPSSFDFSIEELWLLAVKNSPMLKMQERTIDRSDRELQLARKQLYPDFEVGFTYTNRQQMPEMYGWMVGARIPLYFWRKQEPEIGAAAVALSSARKKYEWQNARLYFELKDLYLQTTTSRRLLELYRDGVIPQSSLSVDSALAAYQVGSVNFLTLIDSLVTLLDYELKYYEVVADHQKALARLEALVGIELAK
ncbi:MAG: TolC family protein [Acidobacteria bacterium]|nr:TolC family protein [Acidobacteriota bacterium]